MLLTGDIAPGSRLHDGTIAKQLGASRTPVREAILHLANEGLVEQVPQRGTFVKRLTRRDVRELWEMREMIERFAVRRAARHASPKKVRRLQRECGRQRNLVRQLRSAESKEQIAPIRAEWVKSHLAFHRLLVGECRNRRMIKLGENYHILSSLCSLQGDQVHELLLHHYNQAVRFHRAIVKAIRDGDVKRADRLTAQHMRNGRRTMLEAAQQKCQPSE